ncbi:MAG: enoyl-CoA hydratase/isomerase family protein [Anaerolineae bacterium]|jgi:enoyl-CoA hydratase/carnithine racemase
MDTVWVEAEGPVAWIWLNQPRRLNAINGTTLDELAQAFQDLDMDGSVRAIVLAARGPAFSAGFDVAWMAGLDRATIAQELSGVEAVYDGIEGCRKPVLAAVQGAAMGGGLLLAMAADLRLASEQASFGAPEVKIGIFPNLRFVPRLERLVGLGAAKQIVLTGERIHASDALRIGLVEQVWPADELHAAAQSLADHLAGLPPQAVQSAKAAFLAAGRPDFLEWERAEFAACWGRPERRAAMQAFLESRQGSRR